MMKFEVEYCEQRDKTITEFAVHPLSEKHLNSLCKKLAKTVKKLKAKGEVVVVCIDGLIRVVVYSYKDELDVMRSDEICTELCKSYESYFSLAMKKAKSIAFAITA